MATKEFQDCLIDVYRGEITGEVAFEGMLAIADNQDQRYVLGTMLQFETEGKAIIRPLLMRYRLSMLDDPTGRADGAAASVQMNSLPWVDRFATMREIVKTSYLPRYEELATLISTDEDPEAARIAKFMGDHERALVELASNVVAGHSDPAAPVAKLLNFPLPHPA